MTSISVYASHLTLKPEPLEYEFDLLVLQSSGADRHIWTISPQVEGDYTIVARLNVPNGFRATAVSVNGTELADGAAEISLPVAIYTRHKTTQAAVTLWKVAGTIISFLLTLPLTKMWVT